MVGDVRTQLPVSVVQPHVCVLLLCWLLSGHLPDLTPIFESADVYYLSHITQLRGDVILST